MCDRIHIKKLQLPTVIGVPDEEREFAQTVAVSATLSLANSVQGIDDDLSKTVDYYEVMMAMKAVAAEKPRKLIETLAEDLCATVLNFEGVKSVHLEIEKYILPNCEAVSIEITRGEI